MIGDTKYWRKMTFMTVDPSINNLGCAVYRENQLVHHVLLKPDRDAKESGEHEQKTLSMIRQLRKIAETYEAAQIMLEIPEYWAVGGYAARESGSIPKMMFLCGGIYTYFHLRKIPVQTATPRQWKGQLPKDVVRNRMEREMVPRYFTTQEWARIDHNIMDAICIGHFWIFGKV